MFLKWTFPFQNNEQLCVGRCLLKIGQSEQSGAPMAFKTWWGHHYMVGIICTPPPPGWNRVKMAAKTWCGQWTRPHAYRRACYLVVEVSTILCCVILKKVATISFVLLHASK